MSRVLKVGEHQITQGYKSSHKAVDLVKYKNQAGMIVAHSDGEVIIVQTGKKKAIGSTGNASYGNFVKIKHNNGYYTLYAHLENVLVKKGQFVKKGDSLGLMGESGNAYGVHLHFELRDTSDNRIDPTAYLDNDLPDNENSQITYQVYDKVKAKWLSNVKVNETKGIMAYAGNFGNPISALTIDELTYRVHDKVKNKWLPVVQGRANYAGNLGNSIDGLQIENAKYRVHLVNGKWLPWVTKWDDTNSGYAGIFGQEIDAVQIKTI